MNELRNLIFIILLSTSFPLSAQKVTNFSERPTTSATVIENEPTLDGEVINDPVWQAIEPITEMIQVKPDNGQPASERTEIRIAFSPTRYHG